jgi:hypothetical protein
MKKVPSLILACALAPAAPAAGDGPYHQRIERFFTLLQEGKSAEAVDFLYADNPWMSKSQDAVMNVKNQLASAEPLLGKLRGHDLLQERMLAERFVYLSYLAAYERQPIRFVFEYYRPESEWRIFGFSLDDTLDDDIEAAAKRSLLEP